MTFYVIYLVFKFKLPSMASSEENCKIWLWLNPCHHSTAQSLGKEKKKKKDLQVVTNCFLVKQLSGRH